MIQVATEPGMSVKEAASRLVEAVKSGGDAFLIFNDICLAANQFATVETICADYDRLFELRRKEYEASPEGKAAKAKSRAETKRLQQKADELMEALPNLNYSSVGNLLWWLCEIEPARERIGVNVDNARIERAFAKHGYVPHMNIHPDFDENDREIFAKWIIGQSLGEAWCAKTRMMTEKWRERFTK